MPYCIKCGKPISDDAKFCGSCGAPVQPVDDNTKRQSVYEGKIHKCPNCGEIIDSFVTECPACGYELRSSKSLGSVRELSQILQKVSSSEQKIDIISSFYIPNTKEDIYEFAILAAANIKIDSYAADAWYAKLEQAYKKAELSIKDTKEFLYVRKLYKKAKRKYQMQALLKFIIKIKFLIFGIVGIIMAIIGYGNDGWAYTIIGTSGLAIFAISLICGFEK